MVSYEKSKNIQSSVFQKRSNGRLPFFFTSNFLITFEKIHKAQFFQRCIFLHISPPPATNSDQNIAFDHIYSVAKLVVLAKQLKIFFQKMS